MVMFGDNKRFRGPGKIFDNITFRSENYHSYLCRYHLSYKFAKKGKSAEPILS